MQVETKYSKALGKNLKMAFYMKPPEPDRKDKLRMKTTTTVNNSSLYVIKNEKAYLHNLSF